jgi:hypothetical protein
MISYGILDVCNYFLSVLRCSPTLPIEVVLFLMIVFVMSPWSSLPIFMFVFNILLITSGRSAPTCNPLPTGLRRSMNNIIEHCLCPKKLPNQIQGPNFIIIIIIIIFIVTIIIIIFFGATSPFQKLRCTTPITQSMSEKSLFIFRSMIAFLCDNMQFHAAFFCSIYWDTY